MQNEHHQQSPKADIKIRSWGMAGLYGISPLSDSGMKWANDWLMQQSSFPVINEDGAFLFRDRYRNQVAKSALENGLTANAGVGSSPDEGSAFDLNE